jgi:DNA-binding NtrC family response regulator
MLHVLVLDDDEDLRTVLTETLRMLGADSCVGIGSVEELRKIPVDELKRISLIFLDVNLGAGVPSGIDAYHYLKEIHHSGLIYFFTGHAKSHPLIQEAIRASSSQTEVIEKPVKLDIFSDIIEKARRNSDA